MKNLFLLIVFILLSLSCSKVWYKSDVRYERFEVGYSDTREHPMNETIAPYKEQLDEKMNAVIGEVNQNLEKQRPESRMGNWVADLILEESQRLTTKKVDISIQNYGGMRIPNIAKGDITVGKVYEFMPFDNTLEIVEIDGASLLELADLISADGGWPISSGVEMVIENRKCKSFLLNGEKIDKGKIYSLATNNYIAGGGSNCDMLIDLPKESFSFLIRDLIINHIKRDTEQGINQNAELEGRIKRNN